MIAETLTYLKLIAALAAGALWYLFPAIGMWPLVVGLAPWVASAVAGALGAQAGSGVANPRLKVRNARRRSGVALGRTTPLDLPLLLFLTTSSVALWATYQRDVTLANVPFDTAVGWQKYGLIVAALLLGLALSRLPNASAVWGATAGLVALAAAAGGYFLLTEDFATGPAKFALLGRIGAALQAARPALPLHPVGSNQAGAVTAMMTPLAVELVLAGWRGRRERAGRLALATAAICLPIIAAGLLLSASRGAWLALAAALLLWAAWAAGGRLPALAGRRADRLLLPAAALLVALLVTRPALIGFIQSFLGEGINRLELMRLSALLAYDHPFTGVGLGTYPMIFSSYVLLIHVGFIGSAHNLYVDLAAEQGIPGLLAFLAIVAVALRLAWVAGCREAGAPGRQGDKETRGQGERGLPLAGAVAMLIVLLLHGLVDDPIYSRRASLLFLLAPMGLIAGVWRAADRGARSVPQSSGLRYRLLAAAAAALILLATLIARRPILAAWHANLAALDQTRAELTAYRWPDYPIQDALRRQLPGYPPPVNLAPAIARYRAALALDPGNVTANRRLGQIDLSLGDYAAARGHLEAAYAVAPWQRPTRQLLGELWAAEGRTADAAALWRSMDLGAGQIPLRIWWRQAWGEREAAERIRQAQAATGP